MRVRLIAAVLAVCGIAVAGAGFASASSSASATAAKAPITILQIGDTTGATKIIGVTHLAGMEAAAAYYNAHGGIAGHKVIVKHVSDGGDSTTAATDFLNNLSPPPTMCDCGAEGGDAGALIPVVAKNPVFALALNDGASQCLTNAAVNCPHEYTVGGSTSAPAQAAADWFKKKGITKVAVIQEQITFTENENTYMLKAFAKDGITVTTTATFPATALDLTPQVQQAQSSGAQASFVEVLASPTGFALTARHNLAWNAPMLFDVAGSSLDLTTLAPAADLNNVFLTIFDEMNPKFKPLKVATQRLIKYAEPFGGVGAVPLDVASTGWDPVVALNAIVTASHGNLSVAALTKAALKMKPTDPNRTFSLKLGWTKNNHENVLESPKDYSIVGVGKVINGQVYSGQL